MTRKREPRARYLVLLEDRGKLSPGPRRLAQWLKFVWRAWGLWCLTVEESSTGKGGLIVDKITLDVARRDAAEGQRNTPLLKIVSRDLATDLGVREGMLESDARAICDALYRCLPDETLENLVHFMLGEKQARFPPPRPITTDLIEEVQIALRSADGSADGAGRSRKALQRLVNDKVNIKLDDVATALEAYCGTLSRPTSDSAMKLLGHYLANYVRGMSERD